MERPQNVNTPERAARHVRSRSHPPGDERAAAHRKVPQRGRTRYVGALSPRAAERPLRSCLRLPPRARAGNIGAARCLSPQTPVPGADHLSGLQRAPSPSARTSAEALGTWPESRTVRTTCAPGPRRAAPRPGPARQPARPAEPARTACAGAPPACERCRDVAGRPAPLLSPGLRLPLGALRTLRPGLRVTRHTQSRGATPLGEQRPPPGRGSAGRAPAGRRSRA